MPKTLFISAPRTAARRQWGAGSLSSIDSPIADCAKNISPNFNTFHFQKKLSNKKFQRDTPPGWEFCQPPEALNFSI